jgi:hypothetical protein
MAVRMNSNSSAARDSEAAFSWRIIRPPRRTRYGSPRTEKPTSNVSCAIAEHVVHAVEQAQFVAEVEIARIEPALRRDVTSGCKL